MPPKKKTEGTPKTQPRQQPFRSDQEELAAMAEAGHDPDHSSVTGAGTAAAVSSPAGQLDNGSMQQQLASISAMQQQVLGKVTANGKKIDQNYRELKTYISGEIQRVCDDVFLELSRVNSRLESLETMAATPVSPPREPFDPDTTVVIANLPALAQQETDTQLLEKVQHVVSVGLELPGIEVVAVTRRAGRGNTPGLVLAEFVSLDDKKTVLRAKQNLRENAAYSNLYIRSAEGHTDRLLRLNFQTLLQHFDLTRQFWITGSGRLVPRNRPTTNQDQQPASSDSRSRGDGTTPAPR